MSYFARNVSIEDLGELLFNLEKSGVKLSNATPDYSYPSRFKTELPVSFAPFGKAFVLDSLDCIRGTLPPKFFNKSNANFFEAIHTQISPKASVGFGVDLHPKKIPMEDLSIRLLFSEKKIFMGLFGFLPFIKSEPFTFTGQEPLQKVIEMAGLPLTIEKESDQRYVFRHTQAGGELDFVPPVPGHGMEIPSFIYATLPGVSTADALARFSDFIRHPDFDSKTGDWVLSFGTSKDDPFEALKIMAGLESPSKKVEIKFDWHLKNYTDFRELPAIAKLLGGSSGFATADAQLVDFEYAEGKTCRLVTECNKKGQFKIWFNVKSDDDLVILKKFLRNLNVTKKP